jgi:hypothetical protein
VQLAMLLLLLRTRSRITYKTLTLIPLYSGIKIKLVEVNNHHHHHMSVMELGHLLTRSGLTYPEVSSKVCRDSFCRLGNSVIVIDNKIIEQVNLFNYLGNVI